MIVAPMNQNTIVIPPVQTGCCKVEFDSTYPIHLNGIIRQDEFQQSIANVNATISSNKSLLICIIVSVVLFIVGMVLFIAGPLSIISSKASGFSPLIGVGIGLVFLGMIIMTVGTCVTQARRANKMRAAIAAESMKYSSRSPTPCSWRLDATTVWAGGYQRRQNTIIYRILIEIGHPSNAGFNNTVFHQPNNPYAPPAGTAEYHNPAYNPPNAAFAPPPPYSAQPTTGFCSQCGIYRANHADKFCPSCGHMYNI